MDGRNSSTPRQRISTIHSILRHPDIRATPKPHSAQPQPKHLQQEEIPACSSSSAAASFHLSSSSQHHHHPHSSIINNHNKRHHLASPHDLSLTLPSLSISHRPVHPSLARSESSTTLSPSPVTTPPQYFESLSFRSEGFGAHAAKSSPHQLNKLPQTTAAEARSIVLAPISSSSEHYTSPDSITTYRGLESQHITTYGSCESPTVSVAMDQFQAMSQAPSVMQMQEFHQPPQDFFNRNTLQAQVYDAQTLQDPSSASKSKNQKKNSYPCPVAKQYACSEYFTTSGHAARHAKKHTGKKDAICPECSKAFTRKDNMEQHRRTHSGVRATAKSSSSSTDESRTKRLKVEKQKKSSENNTAEPIDTTPLTTINNIPANMIASQSLDMGLGLLDPRLMEGIMPFNNTDASSILSTSFQQQMPTLSTISRPSLHRSSYQDSTILPKLTPAGPGSLATPSSLTNSPTLPSPSVAPALDALALAASRQ